MQAIENAVSSGNMDTLRRNEKNFKICHLKRLW